MNKFKEGDKVKRFKGTHQPSDFGELNHIYTVYHVDRHGFINLFELDSLSHVNPRYYVLCSADISLPNELFTL